MRKILRISAVYLIACLVVICPAGQGQNDSDKVESNTSIKLPAPVLKGEVSLEETLQKRRSVRGFSDEALTLDEVSQLLWAAQGITDDDGFRTAPSAGALYPLEIYVVSKNVDGLAAGVYSYSPWQHELIKVGDKEVFAELTEKALMQSWTQGSAAVIVISAVYERTTTKYGQRGTRYVHMEVGCAAQNIYLQATSLNLGTTFIGAFDDEKVKNILNLPNDEHPLSVMPVGKP
jgi:SagB-type dehydrogenase family enzyme